MFYSILFLHRAHLYDSRINLVFCLANVVSLNYNSYFPYKTMNSHHSEFILHNLYNSAVKFNPYLLVGFEIKEK